MNGLQIKVTGMSQQPFVLGLDYHDGDQLLVQAATDADGDVDIQLDLFLTLGNQINGVSHTTGQNLDTTHGMVWADVDGDSDWIVVNDGTTVQAVTIV